VRGRLVQHDHRRGLEQQPGQSQALFLPAGEPVAPVPRDRVQPVRQRRDQLPDPGRCWGPPPGSRGVSWPRSSRSSARTSGAVLAPSSPAGRFMRSSPSARRRCCWPPTPWPPARSPRRSQGSPSLIRCRPACSGCSCSANISGPGASTWPARHSRWPSSWPAPRSSAIAASSSARMDLGPARTASSWAQRPPALAPAQRGRDDLYPLGGTVRKRPTRSEPTADRISPQARRHCL
jgi:hypothetical protein